MALPVNTAVVLQYLGYTLQRDFLVAADGATTAIIEWNHIDTQPTDQTIIDAAASQAFADWQAEHGGNSTLTVRRGAIDALSAIRAESALMRAALLVVVDEFNRHTDKFELLRLALADATSLAQAKAFAAAITALPQRTGQDLRDAATASIDAGAADV